ncbi:hypothetical protein HUU05_19160 [candidate division KSB1 bacterium]|nr:hypothetical protein [candidate division KSB1 bacterium]
MKNLNKTPRRLLLQALSLLLLFCSLVWSQTASDSSSVKKSKPALNKTATQKRGARTPAKNVKPRAKPRKEVANASRRNLEAEEEEETEETAKLEQAAATDGTPHFVPITDRWRDITPPPYELNVKGHWYDPYNQNLLKGDYPILGRNTFLLLTATTDNLVEAANLPTPSGVSTAVPQQANFFGTGDRIALIENLRVTLELYHGSAAYRPRDWEFRVTPVFNVNFLDLRERNNLNISARRTTNRTDRQFALQELSLEKKLFDLSDHYDFVSLRAGILRFGSDFRGFIFNDNNLGARLFGNLHSNHYQFNAAYFGLLEKDTNSELNTLFDDRNQEVYVFNLYRQDLFTLGYTGQVSFHYNKDRASTYYDTNGFPVRPALIGATRPHEVNAYYLGWTGDGHFGRLNINHALYQVFGRDDFNPIANQPTTINAQMAALELSVDVDWKRYKVSAFYASGDPKPMDGYANGFDTIVDQPVFAGGPFSYWNFQGINLLGVRLVNRQSLVPNLRPSKTEGQANFVNPGVLIFNAAFDAEWTPKLKSVLNANYLRFVNTATLQQFINQPNIRNDIGLDYGLGLIYRPFLNNQAIITLSATALTPFGGFQDIYQSQRTLYSVFASVVLTY